MQSRDHLAASCKKIVLWFSHPFAFFRIGKEIAVEVAQPYDEVLRREEKQQQKSEVKSALACCSILLHMYIDSLHV